MADHELYGRKADEHLKWGECIARTSGSKALCTDARRAPLHECRACDTGQSGDVDHPGDTTCSMQFCSLLLCWSLRLSE